MKFYIKEIHPPRYVEYNDFNGSFTVPGFVVFYSVESVPVGQLPTPDADQYGFTRATLMFMTSIGAARRMIAHREIKVGDTVDVPEDHIDGFAWRNVRYRRQGLSKIYLRR